MISLSLSPSFELEKKIWVQFETFHDNLTVDIDWDALQTILRPREYVDHRKILLWERAFKIYLSNKPNIPFAKSDNLLAFEEDALAIKRIAYR